MSHIHFYPKTCYLKGHHPLLTYLNIEPVAIVGVLTKISPRGFGLSVEK